MYLHTARTLPSVSYTHLDVYKRQGKSSSAVERDQLWKGKSHPILYPENFQKRDGKAKGRERQECRGRHLKDIQIQKEKVRKSTKNCDFLFIFLLIYIKDVYKRQDMERTRLKDIRALLFVGANDLHLPGNLLRTGLLSEPDREQFQNQKLALAPGGKERAYVQDVYKRQGTYYGVVFTGFLVEKEKGK